jgi:hypothetical protein
MFERASVGPHAEIPPPKPLPVTGPITDLADARTLQLLATEHWSLLANRSLIYNETFTRASIFVTAVTGSILALGFVAQASGFEPEFGWFAVLVLVLDLVLGIGTLLRLRTLTLDDFRHVQAMNRIRHAYLEAAPGLDRYIMMSGFDDASGVLDSYGGLPQDTGFFASALQGLTTITAAVAAVVSLLVGGIVGMLLFQQDFASEIALTAGVAGFVIALLGLGFVAQREIIGFTSVIDSTAKFPKPAPQQDARAG